MVLDGRGRLLSVGGETAGAASSTAYDVAGSRPRPHRPRGRPPRTTWRAPIADARTGRRAGCSTARCSTRAATPGAARGLAGRRCAPRPARPARPRARRRRAPVGSRRRRPGRPPRPGRLRRRPTRRPLRLPRATTTGSRVGRPPVSPDVDQAYDLTGATVGLVRRHPRRRPHCPDRQRPRRRPQAALDHRLLPAGDCPLDNAFWSGDQMVYGAGYTSADDVVAHELAHGVIQHTAGLVYWYQSGAINESMSDVFGELVDLADGTGTDAPEPRWQLGEDLPAACRRRDPGHGRPAAVRPAGHHPQRPLRLVARLRRQRRRPHQQRRAQQDGVPHRRRHGGRAGRRLQRPRRSRASASTRPGPSTGRPCRC